MYTVSFIIGRMCVCACACFGGGWMGRHHLGQVTPIMTSATSLSAREQNSTDPKDILHRRASDVSSFLCTNTSMHTISLIVI